VLDESDIDIRALLDAPSLARDFVPCKHPRLGPIWDAETESRVVGAYCDLCAEVVLPPEDVKATRALLAQVHAYIPRNSQLWHRVKKARGL